MDYQKLFCVVALLIASVSCSGAIGSDPVATPAQPVLSNPAATTRAPAATATAQTANAAPPVSIPAGAVVAILIPEKSEARYRVREQLAGVNFPSDAIGATKDITGTIVGMMDGTILPQSKFRVNLTTLKSNDDRRDNFLRQSVLNTRNFPYAQFVPKQVKGLPLPPPTSGDVKFQVTGDLTIRDVTKSVTWDVIGKVDNNQGTGTATTSFNFAYFNLNQPRVPLVLSIEDNIKLEVDVTLQRQ